MFKEGRSRMHIAGVLPAAVYGAGVPFAVAAPMLRFSAIERWSREVWGNARADGRNFHVSRHVPKDVLRPKEFVDQWWEIWNTRQEELGRGGGPLGALMHATENVALKGTSPTIWEADSTAVVELAEGTLAMVKQLLLHDRLRRNEEDYARRTAQRQLECTRAEPGGNLTMEQAIAADVDWDFVADMATRTATSSQTKRIVTAAAGCRADVAMAG